MEHSKEKKHRKGLVLLLLFLVFAMGFLVFLRTSFFCVSSIVVEGNELIDSHEIIEHSGIEPGINILKINLKDAKDRLEAHSFILKANLKRKLPGNIEIMVKERDLIGYIPYMGSYLLIDNENMVISANVGMPMKGLPVFKGIKVEDFKIKERLSRDNSVKFDEIIYISKAIRENIIQYAPVEVNAEDLDDIVITIDDRFIIKIGDSGNIDYKLKYSSTILEKLYPQQVGGEIDVSCGERAFFRPWWDREE